MYAATIKIKVQKNPNNEFELDLFILDKEEGK